MNIIIYNTNSFGGNYEYSKNIADAYLKLPEVETCTVLVPENDNADRQLFIKKILLADIPKATNKLIKKVYFLYRSLINPFKLYDYLKNQAPSIVIFNDYDQYTSWFWVPALKRLKHKHVFTVILHDPDRDQYFPVKKLSEASMSRVMDLMNIAFYHELLPEKPYYQNSVIKVNIPHGLYRHETYDGAFYKQLTEKKQAYKYISILGNIRDEKNYEMIIRCLPYIKNVKLLVAGKAAHSNVPITSYRQLIKDLGLQERVVWEERFMTDDQFQSAIKCSDIILLYYKASFTSQSGVLNLIAPHKKFIIVSDVPSGLRETLKQFKIGKIVPLTDQEFIESVNQVIANDEFTGISTAWEAYLNYASWDNHAAIAVKNFKQVVL